MAQSNLEQLGTLDNKVLFEILDEYRTMQKTGTILPNGYLDRLVLLLDPPPTLRLITITACILPQIALILSSRLQEAESKIADLERRVGVPEGPSGLRGEP